MLSHFIPNFLMSLYPMYISPEMRLQFFFCKQGHVEVSTTGIVVTVLHVYKSRLMRVKPHWFEPIVLLLPSYLFLAWQEQLAGHTSSFQYLTFPIVLNPHGAPESSLG